MSNMDFSFLEPLSYLAAASLVTIFSLPLPKTTRYVALAPTLAFCYQALITSRKWNLPAGSSSSFAGFMVSLIPWSIRFLVLDQLPVHPEVSSLPTDLIDCYRVWNNPRVLPIKLRAEKTSLCSGQDRVVFAAREATKALCLWLVQTYIFPLLMYVTLQLVSLEEIGPDRELLTPSLALQLSSEEVIFRCTWSFLWVWMGYYFLVFQHCLLGILFVGILQFDEPDEWPPLFGNILKVSSLRDFWGRYWHQFVTPSYTYLSRFLARQMGTTPGSAWDKVAMPWLIFTLSGLSHAAVGWALGEGALTRDLLFFELNFLGCAMESAVRKTKTYRRLTGSQSTIVAMTCRALGMLWVFGFFVTVAPLWVYPKLRHSFGRVSVNVK